MIEKVLTVGKKMMDKVSELSTENPVKNEILKILQIFIDAPLSSLSNVLTVGQLAIYFKNYLKKNYPWVYPEWKFWDNMTKFFNSDILTDEDKQKLVEKVSSEKNKEEVGKRIIKLVGNVNTNKKLAYIINATKSLANDAVDLSTYFRICHVISNSLDEDLRFLGEHISESEVPYSIEVSGLQTAGLVYFKSADESGNQVYAFNALANAVNEYAIRSDGTEVIEKFDLNEPPDLKNFASENLSEDDIWKMFDEGSGKK